MRALTLVCLAPSLLTGVAFAQSPDAGAEPAAPAADTMVFESPVPVDLEPPPLPAPDADFSADRALFQEVRTAPEEVRAARRVVEQARVSDAGPLHAQTPALAWLTQAVGGVFGAGAVGLLFGSVGEAIDPGNDRQPLGGFHGAAVGGLVGTAIGSALGVWGAGRLFEKDSNPGWSFLGAGIGTAVGGGAAVGIAAGVSHKDGGATLAIGTVLLCQTALAIVFDDYGLPGRPAPVGAPAVAPLGRHGEVLFVVPLIDRAF